jgi:hypothetical protein
VEKHGVSSVDALYYMTRKVVMYTSFLFSVKMKKIHIG